MLIVNDPPQGVVPRLHDQAEGVRLKALGDGVLSKCVLIVWCLVLWCDVREWREQWGRERGDEGEGWGGGGD